MYTYALEDGIYERWKNYFSDGSQEVLKMQNQWIVLTLFLSLLRGFVFEEHRHDGFIDQKVFDFENLKELINSLDEISTNVKKYN
jgi:hypothetical protein